MDHKEKIKAVETLMHSFESFAEFAATLGDVCCLQADKLNESWGNLKSEKMWNRRAAEVFKLK
jgi:hypothetical protein